MAVENLLQSIIKPLKPVIGEGVNMLRMNETSEEKLIDDIRREFDGFSLEFQILLTAKSTELVKDVKRYQ